MELYTRFEPGLLDYDGGHLYRYMDKTMTLLFLWMVHVCFVSGTMYDVWGIIVVMCANYIYFDTLIMICNRCHDQ